MFTTSSMARKNSCNCGTFLRISIALLLALSCRGIYQCVGSLASCLIEALEFDIPDSNSVIGLETLRLRDLTCNQGQIGGLQSSYISPSNLNGELTEIRLHCDGKYSYGLIHGNLNAAISISSLSLDTSVSKLPDSQYPGTISSTSCSIPSFNVKLTFSGGAAGEVLNLISPLAESMIKNNVKSTVCSKLSQLVSVDGTQMLQSQLDPTIREIIEQGHPDNEYPAGDLSTSGYVHWAKSLLGIANNFIFDNYSGRVGGCLFGDKFKSATVKPNRIETLPVPMDSIISHYTNGTGKFSVNLGTTAILPIPSKLGANSSVRFEKISVAGLESLTVLDVLHPSVQYNLSLINSFFIGHLEIVVDFTFCSEISGEQICEERNSSLISHLTNVTIDANCSVGAVQKKLNSMHVEDLFSVPFWLSTIDFFNITSLSMHSNIESITMQCSDADYEVSKKGSWTSDLDTGIVYLIDNALALFLSDYTELVEEVVSAAVQGPVRHAINRVIANLIKSHKIDPPSRELIKDQMNGSNVGKKGDNLIINWAEFPPLILFRSVADEVTSDDLNRFVECLAENDEVSPSSIFQNLYPGQQGHPRPRLEGSQNASQRISVSGLNSFYDVSIFEPYAVDNTAKVHNLVTRSGMGTCDENICRTLDFRYSKPSDYSSAPLSLENTGSFSSATMSLQNLHLQLELLSEMTMGTYRSLQIGQLAKPGCALSNFQTLSIESLALQISAASVNIGFFEKNQGEKTDVSDSKALDVTVSIRKLFKLLGAPSSVVQINNLLAQYSRYSKKLCSADSTAFLSHDSLEMALETVDAKERVAWDVSMSVIGVCLLSGLVFLVLTAWCYTRRTASRGEDLSSSYSPLRSTAPSADVEMRAKEGDVDSPVRSAMHDEMEKCGKDNVSTHRALCLNEELSLAVRLFLPLAIVGNAALFVYSNICMDAVAVIVTLSSGVFTSLPEPVLAFGLVGTIVSMWEAKVYLLSILVAFLSGLWPYIKLIALLACFLLPAPCALSQHTTPRAKSFPFYGVSITVNRRYQVLRLVENLGKWGLLDFYVMVLMMCAFHLDLELPMSDSGMTSASPLLVEVLVKPNFGFFSFLLATMASHALSHIILACHRHTVDADVVRLNKINTLSGDSDRVNEIISCDHISKQRWCLIDSEFLVFAGHLPDNIRVSNLPLHGDIDERLNIELIPALQDPSNHAYQYVRMHLTDLGKGAVCAHMLLLVVFVIAATSMFSFSFEFQGLVGWILQKQGQGKNIVDYSFDSVGWSMQEAAGIVGASSSSPPHSWLKPQIFCMQICYFAFGLVAPVLLLIVLLLLWLLPLSRSNLVSALVAADTIGAWTALDVFCLSIAAALLEIRQFAAFIVGDHCGDIDSIAAYFLPLEKGQEMTCFDVVTSLKMNFVCLALSAVLLQLTVSCTSSVARKAATTQQTSRLSGRCEAAAASPSTSPPRRINAKKQGDLESSIPDQSASAPLLSESFLLEENAEAPPAVRGEESPQASCIDSSSMLSRELAYDSNTEAADCATHSDGWRLYGKAATEESVGISKTEEILLDCTPRPGATAHCLLVGQREWVAGRAIGILMFLGLMEPVR